MLEVVLVGIGYSCRSKIHVVCTFWNSEIVLENGKTSFWQESCACYFGRGKNMKDQESQREFVILHRSRCFCSGKNIFPQRGENAQRGNKRKTNRPSFFRTDFCPITKYFLALSNQFLLSNAIFIQAGKYVFIALNLSIIEPVYF